MLFYWGVIEHVFILKVESWSSLPPMHVECDFVEVVVNTCSDSR